MPQKLPRDLPITWLGGTAESQGTVILSICRGVAGWIQEVQIPKPTMPKSLILIKTVQ